MLHVIQHDVYDYENHDKASFDIDFPVSTIQSFANSFRPQSTPNPNNTKVHMASNKWFGIDESRRAIWD
jgi:hypothetical protein